MRILLKHRGVNLDIQGQPPLWKGAILRIDHILKRRNDK